jgi:hypothetical protein
MGQNCLRARRKDRRPWLNTNATLTKSAMRRHSEYDARHISHAVCRTHDWRTVARRNGQVRIAHSCVKRGEPAARSDGIMDHKQVLVTRNQADKLLQQTTELGNFVIAGRSNNSTGRENLEQPTRLVKVVIVRDIQPVQHLITSKLSRNTSRNSTLLHVPTC